MHKTDKTTNKMSQDSSDNQSKSSIYAKKHLCGHHHPECAYYNRDRHKVLYRKSFLMTLIAIIGLVSFYYVFNNYIYNSSSRSIIALHESYLNNIENLNHTPLDSINVDSLTTDSKIFLQSLKQQQHAIILSHKEEASALKSVLEIHLTRIGDDFNSLTLWASVLMIIFLVFSLYAMYKMDEMQHRGNEALDGIYKAHAAVLSDIKDFNKTYSDNINKLENDYAAKVKEINDNASYLLDALKQKISDNSTAIDNKTKEFEKLFSQLELKLNKNITDKAIEIAKKEKVAAIEELENKSTESTAKFKELFDAEKKELYRIVSALNLSAQLNKVSTPSKTNTEKSDKSEESANANTSNTDFVDNDKELEQAEGGDTTTEDNSVDK